MDNCSSCGRKGQGNSSVQTGKEIIRHAAAEVSQHVSCNKEQDPCDPEKAKMGEPAFAEVCPPWLCNLPGLNRVEILGAYVPGKDCFAFLDSSVPGFAHADGKGGFIVSPSPCFEIPEIWNPVMCEGEIQQYQGMPIRSNPPAFPFLLAMNDEGCLSSVRGPSTGTRFLAYSNGRFVFLGRFCTDEPIESASRLELAGFTQSDCNTNLRCLKRLSGGPGIIWVDGKDVAEIYKLCEPDSQSCRNIITLEVDEEKHCFRARMLPPLDEDGKAITDDDCYRLFIEDGCPKWKKYHEVVEFTIPHNHATDDTSLINFIKSRIETPTPCMKVCLFQFDVDVTIQASIDVDVSSTAGSSSGSTQFISPINEAGEIHHIGLVSYLTGISVNTQVTKEAISVVPTVHKTSRSFCFRYNAKTQTWSKL